MSREQHCRSTSPAVQAPTLTHFALLDRRVKRMQPAYRDVSHVTQETNDGRYRPPQSDT